MCVKGLFAFVCTTASKLQLRGLITGDKSVAEKTNGTLTWLLVCKLMWKIISVSGRVGHV